MSTLTALKMVTAKRTNTQNPVLMRRNKLSNKLWEQMELVRAHSEGRLYAPTKFKTFANKITGERHTVEVAKRVKQWWWTADTGKINLSIKYGSKVIDIAKGKNAIELSTMDELLPTLNIIKLAVEAGELDAQMDGASAKLRSAFIK